MAYTSERCQDHAMKLKQIPLDLIDEPEYDVRTQIVLEELEELASSIKAVGVLKPLRVFERDARYEIEDGHRRYLSAKMVDVQVLPCIVIKSGDAEREYKKLHANLHSSMLTPMEQARTLHHLREKYGYSIEDLCQVMGKSQGRISQILALINYAPDIKELMEDRKISEHIGRALNKIKNTDKRKYYSQYAIDGGATINTVRGWVAREAAEATMPKPPPFDWERPPPPPEPTLIKGRCSCCRADFQLDTLMVIKFCGECYTDLMNIMPSLYKAMKIERTAR